MTEKSYKILPGQIWSIKKDLNLPYAKVIICYVDRDSFVVVKPVHDKSSVAGKGDFLVENENITETLYIAMDVKLQIPLSWLDKDSDVIAVSLKYTATLFTNIPKESLCPVKELSELQHTLFASCTEEKLDEYIGESKVLVTETLTQKIASTIKIFINGIKSHDFVPVAAGNVDDLPEKIERGNIILIFTHLTEKKGFTITVDGYSDLENNPTIIIYYEDGTVQKKTFDMPTKLFEYRGSKISRIDVTF